MKKTKVKKVLFTATVDSHILSFHLPYLKYFKDKGYEVHVATNGTEKIPHTDVKHIIPFERSPIKVGNLKAILQLKKIIDREKYEIIHTHTPMGGVVTRLAAIKARKKYKTRVIYTAHGFHFYTGAPLANWILYYPIEKILAKQTDDLITINNEDYDRARKKFHTRVHHVPGVGVDLKKFKPVSKKQKNQLRLNNGYKENDFILLCVAEFTENKNQKFIINSTKALIKDIPNLKIVFAGIGEKLQEAKDLTDKLKLSEVIRFEGYRKDIENTYNLSDVVVSASLREGLPINIIEAMASGLPIVCSSVRGHVDLIKNRHNGLTYDVNRPEEYIIMIKEFILDKTLHMRFGTNNLTDVKKYSIQSSIEKTANIYRDVYA